jgi:hypothetical protein
MTANPVGSILSGGLYRGFEVMLGAHVGRLLPIGADRTAPERIDDVRNDHGAK